jgi:beta-lactamase class A
MVNKKRRLYIFILFFLSLGFMVFSTDSDDFAGFKARSAGSDGFIAYEVLFVGADGLLGLKVLPSSSGDFFECRVVYDGSDYSTENASTFYKIKIEGLKKRLESAIRQSGAEVGLALKDLESGEELLIHTEEVMHAASLMKVPVMIEVFKQAVRGKFSLEDKILVKNQFKSIVDGSPYSLLVAEDSDDDIYQLIGKELTIRDLVKHMITVSSNLATNILIELVGAKNVMEAMNDLGIRHMEVLRGVEDTKAYERGLNNKTDALSMMQVMLSIVEGKAGSVQDCREMIDILAQQKFRAKIPAGIPEGVKVANKTGSITRIDHDAALVFPEGRKPYVLVVLTRGIDSREDAERLIAKLSRLVYENLAVEQTKK